MHVKLLIMDLLPLMSHMNWGGVNLKHGITSPPYLLHAFPFTVSLRSKLSFHDGALQAISIEQNIAEVGIETIV